MRRALALLLTGMMLAGPVSPALAASADFNDVEAALMCDTCNVPLNIAESTRADQQRAQIRRLIAQGKTKEEILDVFVAEYGPNVLAEPKDSSGSAIALWAIPVVVVVVAAISVALLLPRWRRRRRETAGGPPKPEQPLAEDDAKRLERDLALYDL